MSPQLAIRRVVLGLVVLLLLAFSWAGFSGGVHQLSFSHSAGEMAQTFTQFGYGLFALLSVATTFVGRRWARVVSGGWVISASMAAGLATVVWGGRSLLIGLLSAMAASLVALGLVWMLRVGARGLPSP